MFEHGFQLDRLFRPYEKVPYVPAFHFCKVIAGYRFTRTVKSHDAAFRIEYYHQSADRIQKGREYVALLLQFALGLFKIGDIERNPMNEPGTAIAITHHLRVAMEPDHPAITRHHTVS